MTKKRKLTILAVAAHLIVAAVAISADLMQPPQSREPWMLLAGFLTTVAIVATVLFLGNEGIHARAARAAVSFGVAIVVSGFLWIATYSVFLLTVLLFRRLSG